MKSNSKSKAAGPDAFAHLRPAAHQAATNMIVEAGKKRRGEASALDLKPQGVAAQIIEAGKKHRGEE